MPESLACSTSTSRKPRGTIVKMADDLGKLLQEAGESWQGQLRRELATKLPSAALGAGAAVLSQLDPASGMSQTALTAQMRLSKQAVQQLLDQLEAQGLVRREPDPVDKRAKQVALTPAGADAAARRASASANLEEQLRETLGRKRFKALRKALRELAGS
jgi:DNA-binding MarR family transcriptional regulator